MQEKVYFYLFILCTILPQEIFGKFLEDDIGEKSNVHIREKRVISRIPGEDVPVATGVVPYLVNIKRNRRLHCVGTILSHRTVITAASCVVLEPRNYEILSGSIVANKGVSHNIVRTAIHGHDSSRSSTLMTGIALVIVSPPIEYKNSVFQISLYTEPVRVGMTGIISGWGSFVRKGQCESRCSPKLRSIIVPIMDHQICRNIYRGNFPVTEEDFCTYNAERQCGYTDAGAPFVIANKIVGVHIGGINTEGREFSIKPDVFVLLQHPAYSQWINRNIVL